MAWRLIFLCNAEAKITHDLTNSVHCVNRRLLASGRLDEPSLSAPGFVDSKRKRTTAYRTCGVTDPNDRSNAYTFVTLWPILYSPSDSADSRRKRFLN